MRSSRSSLISHLRARSTAGVSDSCGARTCPGCVTSACRVTRLHQRRTSPLPHPLTAHGDAPPPSSTAVPPCPALQTSRQRPSAGRLSGTPHGEHRTAAAALSPRPAPALSPSADRRHTPATRWLVRSRPVTACHVTGFVRGRPRAVTGLLRLVPSPKGLLGLVPSWCRAAEIRINRSERRSGRGGRYTEDGRHPNRVMKLRHSQPQRQSVRKRAGH